MVDDQTLQSDKFGTGNGSSWEVIATGNSLPNNALLVVSVDAEEMAGDGLSTS